MTAVFILLQQGKTHSALAQLVQNMKALHQSTLDNGSWKNAWLLTGLVDPAAKRRFGGTEEELEIVHEYGKTLDELEKRVRGPPSKEDGEKTGKKG